MMFEKSVKRLEGRLESVPNRGSFFILKNEVIDTGKCMKCGMCVPVCNYNALTWNVILDKPELSGKCVACGVCYQECPQSSSSVENILGPFVKGFITKNKTQQGQDGGTVRGLLSVLFEKNLIDTAIVTKMSSERLWAPQPFIAKSETDLSQISTSIYTHSQVLGKFIEAVKQGSKKIAIVGCPCKAEGIRALFSAPNGLFKGNSNLKVYNIGLFCTEVFVLEKLYNILETKNIELTKITKFDFSGGKFRIYTKEGDLLKEITNFPISALKDATETSCEQCPDFSAECADISIGSAGSPEGFNTVITRTPEMAQIIDSLIIEGRFESKPFDSKVLQIVMKLARSKRDRVKKVDSSKEYNPHVFLLHKPPEWNYTNFTYTAEQHMEHYQRAQSKEISLNSGSGHSVYIAKTPVGDKSDITKYNYASSYDLTTKLLLKYPKAKGGKILIKPNNTGFIGVFKHDVLAEILARNGCTDDCDHQPIATHPAMIAGIVDALLDFGVKRIDLGENMLWDGGTQRAFYETGYVNLLSQEKYKGKVFFVDLYENDPPTTCLEKLTLPLTRYCKGDYYNECYPPKALFSEKYDLVLIASVAKSHNCAYYTLAVKNFSVSWNPRKKTGKVEPRWQIHGLPLDVFKTERISEILGNEFHRKNIIHVRETYRHAWDFRDKHRTIHPAKSNIILSNNFISSGLIRHFRSYQKDCLDVDPHHWSGINLGILTLGIGYLINRYTRIFAAVVKELRKQGTEVACICSGIVGQEGDGPLIYGQTKYAGFNVASFDFSALERVTTELMYAENDKGFAGFLKTRQIKRMQEHNIKCPELIDEAEQLWTLRILHDLIGGNFDLESIPLILLNYTGDLKFNSVKPLQLYQLRNGSAFRSSLGYYCNPDLWLKLLHNNDSLYMMMFLIERGDIEIPLIPGVVG